MANFGDSKRRMNSRKGMVNHYYFYCVDEDFGPFFSEVLLVLSLQRQALHQRA
jgi:hypothetical protein